MIESIQQGFLTGAYGASMFFGFMTIFVGILFVMGLIVSILTGFSK